MKKQKKIEYCCDAEMYVVKTTSLKRPTLRWNRVYDSQDNITYIVKFDNKNYNEDIILEDENTACWTVPFDLTEKKVYLWTVRAYDGYEEGEESKKQFIQYINNVTIDLMSYIDVRTEKRKNLTLDLFSTLNVIEAQKDFCLESEIFVDKVNKFQPSVLYVKPSRQTFLPCELKVKERNEDYIYSEIYIKTKKLLPPKAPLLVEMQSDFDFVTGNLKPTFSWWKSLDELFCNDILYEIQVDTNPFFFSPIFFEAKNIKNPISQQMVYPMPYELSVGKFYWRVRSTDGINFSNWVYGTEFTIESSKEDLLAEIEVVDNFVREKLDSNIIVREKRNLESNIDVLGLGNDFLPSITVVWKKVREFLNSELYIYVGELEQMLFAEIDVKNNFSNLNSGIFVKIRETLLSHIRVWGISDSFLQSKINVLKCLETSIGSEICVFNQKTNYSLDAKINVIKPVYFNSVEQMQAEIKIIKVLSTEETILSSIYVKKRIELTENKFSEIFVYYKKYSELECFLDVKSVKLDEIKVYSNKNHEEWFNDNEVKFWWEITEDNKDIVKGYIMQFNQQPDYDPQLGKDYYQYENGEKLFNARVFDISGEYYFHIQSFDKNYQTSPVTHYKVLYNNKPSIPENLKINNNVLTEKNKLISKNENNLFSWDSSYDSDQNDWYNIRYEIQICNEPTFETPDFNSELIKDNFIELSFNEFLFSGTYYFRVRSFDGKQYSDWSRVSSFIINTAPTVPDNISFYKKE